MSHILCSSNIFAGRGSVAVYTGDGSAVNGELLGNIAASFIDRNNLDLCRAVLVCGYQHIAVRLFRSINPDIPRPHPLGILCHAVSTLGDVAVFLHGTIAAADIPPHICIQIAHSQAVVDILGNIQCHRPHISIILAVCVYFGHPDVLSAVFQSREIHLAALCAIEMRTEQTAVFKGLGIVEDCVINILTVLEALRRHQLGIRTCCDGFSVIGHKCCAVRGAPVGPVMGIVRLILYGNSIKINRSEESSPS